MPNKLDLDQSIDSFNRKIDELKISLLEKVS